MKFVLLLLGAGFLCWAHPAAASTPIEAIVYYTQTASANPTTCNSVATYDASGTGSTQLVGLASGQTIYICGYTIFSPGGVANAQLVYGTGSNCATGQTGLTPPYELSTQRPIIDGRPYVHGLQTAASNALCLVVTSNGYLHYRTITIDHTKVGTVNNTDQSNFPVLISGIYPSLATAAHGGYVQNASGYDIIFTSDAAGTTTLNYEVETYNATTGTVNFWVKVPTVSHSADTTIYMWYDNSAISSSQANATSVWDSHFKGVWHFPNGSSLTTNDSTSNANNGTSVGAAATTGQIDGGASFAGSQYISTPYAAVLSNFTVCVWFTSTSDTASIRLVDKTYNTGFWMGHETTGAANQWGGGVDEGSPPYGIFVSLTNGSWHQLCSVASGSTHHIYGDGGAVSANNVPPTMGTDSSTFYIGEVTAAGGYEFVGSIDEVELSDSARSIDWISTEYNNQKSPSTFYTVSAQQ